MRNNFSYHLINSRDSNTWLESIFIGDYTIVYYSILFITSVAAIFSRSILLYNWCNTASTKLHNAMFSKIIYSPMRFFTINPAGRILNRFSSDMGAVDEILPMTLADTINVSIVKHLEGRINHSTYYMKIK